MPVLAGLHEEVGEIHEPAAVLQLTEADGLDHALALKGLVLEVGLVNPAEVDEIHGGAAHDKEGFDAVAVGKRPILDHSQIVDVSALRVHRELANGGQLTVHQGVIRHIVFLENHPRAGAKRLLLGLGLNG